MWVWEGDVNDLRTCRSSSRSSSDSGKRLDIRIRSRRRRSLAYHPVAFHSVGKGSLAVLTWGISHPLISITPTRQIHKQPHPQILNPKPSDLHHAHPIDTQATSLTNMQTYPAPPSIRTFAHTQVPPGPAWTNQEICSLSDPNICPTYPWAAWPVVSST